MKLGRISDVGVRLEVVLGGTVRPVSEVATIGEGTIIELDSIAGEPVELRAGGNKIAEAEVVVIDESFGVRVTSVVSDVSEEKGND